MGYKIRKTGPGGGAGQYQPGGALPLAGPKGYPTLKTLLAVLKTVGMRLSVEREHHAHA